MSKIGNRASFLEKSLFIYEADIVLHYLQIFCIKEIWSNAINFGKALNMSNKQ